MSLPPMRTWVLNWSSVPLKAYRSGKLAFALPEAVWQPLQVLMNVSGTATPEQLLAGATPVGTMTGAPPVVEVAPAPTGALPLAPGVVPAPPVAPFCPPSGVVGLLEHAATAAERHSS